MADTTTKILEVVVDNNQAMAAIADYNKLIDEQKKKQKELAADFKAGKITQEDYYRAMAKSKEETKAYSRGVQELSKEVQNNVKQSQEQEGSMRSLRAQLSNLTKEFDALSRAEREGDAGRAKMDEINRLTDEIKAAEEQTQRYYRNVGNYSGGVMDAFSKTGGAVGSVINPVKNVTAGFKAMSATPLIGILGLLANIINKVIEKLNSSESSMNRVKVAMAPLNAGSTLLTKVLQKLGEGVAWLAEKLGKWADKMGLVSDKMKEEQRLTLEEIALTKRRREALTQDADAELKIAQLKEKATDKLNYSHSERLKFLKEAVAAEEEMARRNKEIAAQEYQILLDRSKLAENSAEENEKLAQAYANMVKQETAYLSKKKELNAQITEATNQAQAERKAALDAELAAMREATDKRIELMKEGNDKERASEEATHTKTIEDLQRRLATEKNLTTKAREAINQLIELEQKRHQQRMEELDNERLVSELENAEKTIALKLQGVKEGTAEEYNLKREALAKQLERELLDTQLTEEQKLLMRENYNKELEKLEDEHLNAVYQKQMDALALEWDNKIAEAALRGENTLALEVERRKAELDAMHQMEEESDAEFKARMLAAEQAYTDSKKALLDQQAANTQANMEATGAVINSLGQLLSAFGEENEEAAKAAKVLALGEIAINTGKAIAAGVAQAQAAGGFPANIAAIATTVATVLANIATAISTVKSAKFATGGLVLGPGTGTSDSISARLSNGESVMNARSTAMFGPLLSGLNQAGGGVAFNPKSSGPSEGFAYLASAVAAGMKNADLRVGVDEISTVQTRVDRIKEVSTIG